MAERLYSLTTKYPLDVTTYLFILLPIGVGLYRYAYLKQEHKLILVFFGADFVLETISLLLVLRGYSSWPMQDVRATVNTLFVTLIYRQALIRPAQKRIVFFSGLLFLLVSIVSYRGDVMSPWSSTAFRIYALGVALTYYNAILSDLNLRNIQYHSLFWFTAGLLFYAGGTIFVTLFNQYLYASDTPDAIFDRYLNLMQLLYILFCILAAIGFGVSRRDRQNYFGKNYAGDYSV